MQVASQHPHTQDAPTHEIRTPAAASTISGPAKRMPPRVAQPWGQESLDYAQSEGDAQRQARRRTARQPWTWTYGSPGPPTGGNSPSRSRPDGSSWTYTTSWTPPAPYRTSSLTTLPAPDHGTPQPVAVCSHPPYGAHGALYPRRPRPAALAVAPQGGRPHPRDPARTEHLDNQGPTSPGATRPGQGNRAPAPTILDDQGTPEAGSMHQPLAEPTQVTPRRSPTPRRDHGDQRDPETETGQHSPPTRKPPRGSRRSGGIRRQSRTPPAAARQVTSRADADSGQDEPGGRQRREMSPTAEP